MPSEVILKKIAYVFLKISRENNSNRGFVS